MNQHLKVASAGGKMPLSLINFMTSAWQPMPKSEHRNTKLLSVVGAKFKQFLKHFRKWVAPVCTCRLAYCFYIFSNAYYLLLFYHHQHYAPYFMYVKLQNYTFRVVVHRIMISWFCPVKYLTHESDKQFKVYCLYWFLYCHQRCENFYFESLLLHIYFFFSLIE